VLHLATDPTVSPVTLVPQFTPSAQALPGSEAITRLLSGFTFWAFLAALAGMLLGAAMWAVGHHASNYQQAASGRKGVIVSGAAALLIGAAPSLVTFFFNLGRGV